MVCTLKEVGPQKTRACKSKTNLQKEQHLYYHLLSYGNNRNVVHKLGNAFLCKEYISHRILLLLVLLKHLKQKRFFFFYYFSFFSKKISQLPWRTLKNFEDYFQNNFFNICSRHCCSCRSYLLYHSWTLLGRPETDFRKCFTVLLNDLPSTSTFKNTISSISHSPVSVLKWRRSGWFGTFPV